MILRYTNIFNHKIPINMNQTFTQNDLLTLLYDENDSCTNIKVKKELITNAALAAEYRELKQTTSVLDNNLLSPKSNSVQSILNYSRKSIKKEVFS